ncbi:MAG: formimidoylglutamase [Chitinophagales bacterium]
MIQDFLTPVESEVQDYFRTLMKRSVGEQVLFYDGDLPELKKGIALIHVPEYRGSGFLEKSSDALLIRRSLYQLSEIPGALQLIDMGDLKPGAELNDSRAALKLVCEELLAANIFPLIIGGSHDLTYAQLEAFPKQKTGLNLLIADQKIDFFDSKNEAMSDKNFLMEVLTSGKVNLFDFNVIGYQMHFTSGEALHTLDKLNYEAYRLSLLQDNIEEIEPIARDTDVLSFDMGAIRYPDAKGVLDPTPNGFYGQQACQIMRYAGLSGRLKSLGIYGVDTDADEQGQTAQLMAQMIWYFLEARSLSKADFPDFKRRNFIKYSVSVDGTEGEMVFLKSKLSEKWWMEIPDLNEEQSGNRYVIPCSYTDYQLASKNEIPERWMKAVQKFN